MVLRAISSTSADSYIVVRDDRRSRGTGRDADTHKHAGSIMDPRPIIVAPPSSLLNIPRAFLSVMGYPDRKSTVTHEKMLAIARKNQLSELFGT